MSVHLIIEHSAVLCDLQGPLGFYSQQGFEAAHKKLKENFSRGTSHGGGTQQPLTSAAYQIMAKQCRVFVSDIRLKLQEGPKNIVPETASYIVGIFGETAEELAHSTTVHHKDVSRIKRKLESAYNAKPGRRAGGLFSPPPVVLVVPTTGRGAGGTF